MSKDEKTPPVANQHLADKIAGKVDENGKAIDQDAQETPVAETPKVDQNEHMAKIHENDNEDARTPIAGEPNEETPGEETPGEPAPEDESPEETPGEETPGEDPEAETPGE